ncbi:MAG: hypothetical protein LBT35_03420 [Tannerella sp.]|jgi:uncharacterized protein involved in exopolysaccharide biosynthesis|nr:hypothetical protein [Tannerella sp.]
MKRFIVLFIVIAVSGLFGSINAQEVSDRTISAKYKQEIDVASSEIKTLKLKLKSDKDNIELKSELKDKSETLKDLKEKKAVIDKAIKSKAASEKAVKKAERAAEQAEKAKLDAERAESKAKKLKEKEQ